MSPGITTITRADLPLVIENPDYRCPRCGRRLMIKAITQMNHEGRVPLRGLEVICTTEPITPAAIQRRGKQWAAWHSGLPGDWDAAVGRVHEWFDNFYRFREMTPKELTRKRLKWRRSA